MEISLSKGLSHDDSVVLGHVTKDNVTYYKYTKNGSPPKISSNHLEIGQEAIVRYWNDISIFYHIEKPVSMTRTLAKFKIPTNSHNFDNQNENKQNTQEISKSQPKQAINENLRYKLTHIHNQGNLIFTFYDNEKQTVVNKLQSNLTPEFKKAIQQFLTNIPI